MRIVICAQLLTAQVEREGFCACVAAILLGSGGNVFLRMCGRRFVGGGVSAHVLEEKALVGEKLLRMCGKEGLGFLAHVLEKKRTFSKKVTYR